MIFNIAELASDMKYVYEEHSHQQFEGLVVALCTKLLGMGVHGFATGPDGGRDAKFTGTAAELPSRAAPWVGTCIVQAKHTNGYNKCFSDSDFFSQDSEHCVIRQELPRIKKLRETGELDHYLLFANRRLAGNTQKAIEDYLVQQTGIPKESLRLCGREDIDLWVKIFPDVPSIADIDPVDGPLIITPDELAEIISVFSEKKSELKSTVESIIRIDYEQKNLVNNMDATYAKKLLKHYLKDSCEIQDFLSRAENADSLQQYQDAISEIDLRIASKRKHYQGFESIMEYLAVLLFDRDVILRRNKRLTRALLFYMYWNCDIGVDCAATN